MIRTQVSLDKALYRAAQQEAKRRGISFAELCRRALARIVPGSEEERPWLRYSGCLDTGDPRSSQTVDEVVYNREKP
ncbi:MAG: CopG family transcriptional regulator [Planctomycetota bacterium]